MAGFSKVLSPYPVNAGHSLNTGLVAWWKVLPNRNQGAVWYDLVSRLPGTLTNMTPNSGGWGGAPPPGGNGSLRFDGVNDYVVTGPTKTITNTNITMIGSAFLSSASLDGTFFHYGGPGGAGGGITLGVGNTTVGDLGNHLCGLFDEIRHIGTSVVLGTGWVRTGFVINSSGKPTFYVNGQSVYSDSGSNAKSPNDSTISIGADSESIGTGFPRYFAGQLDSVKVYFRALSSAEMLTDYLQELTGCPDSLNRSSGKLYSFSATYQMLGIAASVGVGKGSLYGIGNLAGRSLGVGSQTSLLGGTGNLSGKSSGSASQTSTLYGTGYLAGRSYGSASSASSLRGTGTLLGRSYGSAFTACTPYLVAYLLGKSLGIGKATGSAWSISGNPGDTQVGIAMAGSRSYGASSVITRLTAIARTSARASGTSVTIGSMTYKVYFPSPTDVLFTNNGISAVLFPSDGTSSVIFLTNGSSSVVFP